MTLALIVAGWVACGVLTHGITYADARAGWRGYPKLYREERRRDRGFAVLISLAGPVGLIVSYLLSGLAEHGLRYRDGD